MAITHHEAITDDGGAIGADIISGAIDQVFPEVTLFDQSSGIIINRKIYIANDDVVDVSISVSMESATVFPAILFASTGDAQVVGDLTGSETDESPIVTTIPASGHLSFWIRLTVPPGSTEQVDYNTIKIKEVY